MCRRATNLDIPGDLEIRHDLASADDLEIRHSRIRDSRIRDSRIRDIRHVKQQPMCARGELVVVRCQKPAFDLDDHQ